MLKDEYLKGACRMDILLMRVDDRLIHTEFICKWCDALRPDHLIVIDEELLANEFKTKLFRSILPLWMDMEVLSAEDAAKRIADSEEKGKFILLGRSPKAFVDLMEKGVSITTLTFADKAYFPNKISIPQKHQAAVQRLKEAKVTLVAVKNPGEEYFIV